MNTFEDFKNQVAVKHGYTNWFAMKNILSDKKSERLNELLISRLEEATTLFVESERKRHIEKFVNDFENDDLEDSKLRQYYDKWKVDNLKNR